MAKESDDCEHWLLPQFLTDDDEELFTEFKTNSNKNHAKNTTKTCFGIDLQNEFGYLFGPFRPQTGFSSPVGGSTVTETDDDDYITGLTQQLAHSTLHDSVLAYQNNNRSKLFGALCGGCGCSHGSSRGSPNCPSQVALPPEINRSEAAWDLLCAAAGEVARMRMMDAAAGCHSNKNSGLVGPPRKPSLNLGFRPNHKTHLSYQQHLKAAKFEQLWKEQMMKEQLVVGAWGQGKFRLSQTQQMIMSRGRTGGGKPKLSMAASATIDQEQYHRQQKLQQQQAGSGMRAVFLGNPGSRRGCSGTGVFLPRRLGTPAEPRKISACSTVLLPDRVVQALNLSMEAMDAPAQPIYSGGVTTDYDCNSVAMDQQRRSARQQTVVMNQVQDIRLPQEWSY